MATVAMSGDKFDMQAYEEKFAELIVKECADLVKDYRDEMIFYLADFRIKERFGVE